MLQLKIDEVGGAVVRRVFNTGGKQMTPGTVLSREEIMAFPAVNRSALANKRYIDLFPRNPGNPQGSDEKGERYVISAGFGRFFVIEGKKLNDEAITREEAYALCGMEPPTKGKRKK
jgi:hypothetical protein